MPFNKISLNCFFKKILVVEERGWEADLSSNMLQPKKIGKICYDTYYFTANLIKIFSIFLVKEVQQSTSLANFSQLTDLVIHLEKS